MAVAPLLARWLERLLAGHRPSLTVAQYEALRAVAAGEASGASLARRAGVSGPAVSQLLAGLVDAGLLRRDPQAGDRRRRALALSGHGRRVLRSADALLADRLESLLGELPPPEADALARALPVVAAGLAGTPPPRRPRPPRPPGAPPARRPP